MTVHLLKLCVGIDTVRQLEDVQAGRRERLQAEGREPLNVHITRNTPRRADEIVNGGSLYWVIRRRIQVRQKILRIDALRDLDGRPRCGLVLDPGLVRVEPRPCRAFQGWRYLDIADAPGDRAAANDDADDNMPEEMHRELQALGLI